MSILGSRHADHLRKRPVIRRQFNAWRSVPRPKVSVVKNRYRSHPCVKNEARVVASTRSLAAACVGVKTPARQVLAGTVIAHTLGLCLAISAPAHSSPIEPLWADMAAELASKTARQAFAALSTANDAAEVKVQVIQGPADPRLRLAPCEQVEVFAPTGHRPWGRTRIGLRCVRGPVAWKITVPLTVQVWAPAWVTSQALPAGAVIDAGHLTRGMADWAERATPVLMSDAALIGRTLSSAVPAGTAIRADQLRERRFFEAGDPVRIVAGGQGFAVSGTGEALTTGLEGRSVRVRTASGRTLSGTAVGPREVEIRL